MASAEVAALALDRVYAEEKLAPLPGDEYEVRNDASLSAANSDLPNHRTGYGLSQRVVSMKHTDSRAFHRILVAYDGSPQAQHAAQIALSLAKSTMARVLILAVIGPAESDDTPDFRTRLYYTRKSYEASFAALCEQANEADIFIETRISIGKPAEEIVDRAELMRANLIIMGRRTKFSFRHWLLGSDSEWIIRKARCAVMLVH